MKHISFVSLFICIAQIVHGMEKTPEEITRLSKLCIDAINDFNQIQLKKTLDAGADVNYKDSDGKSLFYLASQTSNNTNQLINELIMHESIDLSSRDPYGSTPLHWACKLELTSTIQSMLNKMPQTANMYNNAGEIPLHTATYHGKKECVELLLSHNIETINQQNYNGHTALHLVCKNQINLDMIKLLIEKGADTTIKDNEQVTPLFHFFHKYYHGDTVNQTHAFYDFINNHPSIASKLVHIKDIQNNSQLHLCITMECFKANTFDKYLRFLMNNGVDIHARNNDGKRAIDLVYDEYNACYNQYIAKKICLRKLELNNQERILHAFLRLISPHTPCALFKLVLEQKLLKEVIAHIICDYYALNIETVIAKKYKHHDQYYDCCIENKQKIRQQLLANPEPRLLWSA